MAPTSRRRPSAPTSGALGLRYDPSLARTLDAFDLDKPLPDSWDLFDQLRGMPILTIRGANSDLLSPETVAAMQQRWPGNETMVVPGQGHAPLLAGRRHDRADPNLPGRRRLSNTRFISLVAESRSNVMPRISLKRRYSRLSKFGAPHARPDCGIKTST